jgi:hypothetical protein
MWAAIASYSFINSWDMCMCVSMFVCASDVWESPLHIYVMITYDDDDVMMS